jgi:hypothetical protein
LLYVAWRLQHGLAVSLAVSASLAFVISVACAVSRYVRCIGILGVPTVASTTGGRLALIVVASGLVIGGPVANVCRNVRSMSGGLACGLELGRNQSALLAGLGVPSSASAAAVTG